MLIRTKRTNERAERSGGSHLQRSARPAHGIVVAPCGIEARVVGSAHLADGAPLALPVALRNVIQRRVHAVDVVGYVALVAQQQAALVVALAAALAHGAVQTPPALLQDHLRYLLVNNDNKQTK